MKHIFFHIFFIVIIAVSIVFVIVFAYLRNLDYYQLSENIINEQCAPDQIDAAMDYYANCLEKETHTVFECQLSTIVNYCNACNRWHGEENED